MIWLVGSRGMLGTEVDSLLQQRRLPYLASGKEVDITDPDQLRRFASGRDFSWIINCSAYTAVDQAEDEPEAAFAINADGPGRLAALAREKNARLVHISTDYVFDGTKTEDYRESDPPSPIGVYGRSKYQGEVNIINTHPAHIIVRTAWLYGRSGPSFVATMLRLFRERAEVGVVNDQYGSP
ncbi:MAG: SDR family oxidoreductase, partial [Desulfosudaceae bacterium]